VAFLFLAGEQKKKNDSSRKKAQEAQKDLLCILCFAASPENR
jgi:hypothetical protein